MFKYKSLIAGILAILLAGNGSSAYCPVCTIAAGAGVCVARFYGISDLVVGLWIGALVVSTALLTNNWLKKKYIPMQGEVLSVLLFILTVVPLYFTDILGNAQYLIWGVDKLIWGMLIGSVLLYSAVYLSKKIKEKNGKVLFPYQTIAIILSSLIIASLLLCWF